MIQDRTVCPSVIYIKRQIPVASNEKVDWYRSGNFSDFYCVEFDTVYPRKDWHIQAHTNPLAHYLYLYIVEVNCL